jgi:cytochrome c peroxidase
VQACVSCHNPSFGWEDGHKTAVGENMLSLARNSPTIINRAWGEIFFWDGRAESLEQQATGPITAAGEMNTPINVLIDRLKAISGLSEEVRAGISGPRHHRAEHRRVDRHVRAHHRFRRIAVRPLGRRR